MIVKKWLVDGLEHENVWCMGWFVAFFLWIPHYLVGGLEHEFYFSLYWECHNPNWRTPSFFRGVETTNQMMLGCWLILPWYCHDMHIFFFGCSWFIGPTGFVQTWWICLFFGKFNGEHDVLNPWFPMLGQAHSGYIVIVSYSIDDFDNDHIW